MAEKKTMSESTAKIKNAAVLCACIVVAFFMWVYVMTVDSPDYKEVFDGVTVQLTGTDALSEHDLAVFSGYGIKIDVTLAGKKSILSRIKKEELVVSADVSAVETAGRYNIKLMLDIPAGCKLVSLSQDTLAVYADVSAQKTVELYEYRENMSLPESCFTGEIVYPVDLVTVSGPLDVLARVEGAAVTLDMSDVTKTTKLTEKIYLIDSAGTLIESPYVDYFPKEITVEVPVLRTVTVPIEVEYKYGFLSYGNTIVNVIPEAVEVTGDSELIAKGGLVMPITVDERTFDGGRYETIVTLEGADGVELSTNKAKIAIELAAGYTTKEFTIDEERIAAIGESDDIIYTWRKTPVTVTLLGHYSDLVEINADDLSLVFDVSSYSSSNTGTMRVRAEVVNDSETADRVFVVGQYFINVNFDKRDD